MFSSDDHCCDGNQKYIIYHFKSHINWKRIKSSSQCCKPFENRIKNSWDIPKSGAKYWTCWNLHRSASHGIFLHRRCFGAPHHRYAASQRVAGPLSTMHSKARVSVQNTNISKVYFQRKLGIDIGKTHSIFLPFQPLHFLTSFPGEVTLQGIRGSLIWPRSLQAY